MPDSRSDKISALKQALAKAAGARKTGTDSSSAEELRPDVPVPAFLIRETLDNLRPQDVHVAKQYQTVMRGARQRFDELDASAELCLASDAAPEDLLFVNVEKADKGGRGKFFLAGMMYLRDDKFIIEQCLVRTPEEEQAVMHALVERMDKATLVVTFDKKLKQIDTRARILDLRAEFRRKWKGKLRSFSLKAMERLFCRRHRKDNLDRRAIPEIYEHFLATGDAGPLARVIECNRIDLLSTAQLLCAALTADEPAL